MQVLVDNWKDRTTLVKLRKVNDFVQPVILDMLVLPELCMAQFDTRSCILEFALNLLAKTLGLKPNFDQGSCAIDLLLVHFDTFTPPTFFRYLLVSHFQVRITDLPAYQLHQVFGGFVGARLSENGLDIGNVGFHLGLVRG